MFHCLYCFANILLNIILGQVSMLTCFWPKTWMAIGKNLQASFGFGLGLELDASDKSLITYDFI